MERSHPGQSNHTVHFEQTRGTRNENERYDCVELNTRVIVNPKINETTFHSLTWNDALTYMKDTLNTFYFQKKNILFYQIVLSRSF